MAIGAHKYGWGDGSVFCSGKLNNDVFVTINGLVLPLPIGILV